jgi:hypothetical protein
MKNIKTFICALGLGLCCISSLLVNTGCELNVNADQNGSNGGGTPSPTPTNTPPPGPGPTNQPPSTNYYDQLDISGAVLLGPHKGKPIKRAAVTRVLTKADKTGDTVHMSFHSLNWPSTGSGKRIDGGCYIFWYNGSQLYGGLFDWHGVGQTVKTLGNIPGGYLDGQQPPNGATIWFCILNLDSTERTTVTQSKTTWSW